MTIPSLRDGMGHCSTSEQNKGSDLCSKNIYIKYVIGEKCLHAEILTQRECTLGPAQLIWYVQVPQGRPEHLHEYLIT